MPGDDTQVTEHVDVDETPADTIEDTGDDTASTPDEEESDFSKAFEEALEGEPNPDDDIDSIDDDDDDEPSPEGDKKDDETPGDKEKPGDEAPAADEEDDEDLKRGKELLAAMEQEKPPEEQQQGKAADQKEQDTAKGDDAEPDIVTSKRASIYAKIISPKDFEPRLTLGEDGEEVDVRDYLEANPEMPIVMGAYVQRVMENLIGGGVLADARSSAKEISALKEQVNSLRYELRVAAKAQDVYDIVESTEFKDWQKTAPKEALALFRSKNPRDFARGINLYKKTLAKKESGTPPKAKEADAKAREKMKQKKSLLSHKSGKSAGSGAAGADDFSSAFREASEKETEIEI